MVAGCLAACGAWTGETFAGDADNPKGYFENVRLREAVDKTVLRALGCDPLGVDPLPPIETVPQQPALRQVVETVLDREGYGRQRPWLFKDAKMTLLWPLWLSMFPDALWVIVERPEDEVVRSCLGTGFMARHSGDAGFWRRVVAAYSERLKSLETASTQCHRVNAGEIASGAAERLEAIAIAAGLDWNGAAVGAFVSRDLWTRRNKA